MSVRNVNMQRKCRMCSEEEGEKDNYLLFLNGHWKQKEEINDDKYFKSERRYEKHRIMLIFGSCCVRVCDMYIYTYIATVQPFTVLCIAKII